MRRRRFGALAGASVLAAPALANGQAGWKAERPMTIYNPFATGGGTDIHIGLMGETAGPRLGQQPAHPHDQPTNWNPVRDFTYIIGLSGYTIGIAVRADAPWKKLEELIDAAKKEPDKFNYATSGTGQLTMIEVEQTTGAKFTHVPDKGTAE